MEQQDQYFQLIIILKKERIINQNPKTQNFYLEGHLKVIFLVKKEIKLDPIIQNQIQIEEVQIEEAQIEEQLELQDLEEMNQKEDNLNLIRIEMKLLLQLPIQKIKNKIKILKMQVKILTAKIN